MRPAASRRPDRANGPRSRAGTGQATVPLAARGSSRPGDVKVAESTSEPLRDRLKNPRPGIRYHLRVSTLVRPGIPADDDADGLRARVAELEAALGRAHGRRRAGGIGARESSGSDTARTSACCTKSSTRSNSRSPRPNWASCRSGSRRPAARRGRRAREHDLRRRRDSRRTPFASCSATSRRRFIPTSHTTRPPAIGVTASWSRPTGPTPPATSNSSARSCRPGSAVRTRCPEATPRRMRQRLVRRIAQLEEQLELLASDLAELTGVAAVEAEGDGRRGRGPRQGPGARHGPAAEARHHGRDQPPGRDALTDSSTAV